MHALESNRLGDGCLLLCRSGSAVGKVLDEFLEVAAIHEQASRLFQGFHYPRRGPTGQPLASSDAVIITPRSAGTDINQSAMLK